MANPNETVRNSDRDQAANQPNNALSTRSDELFTASLFWRAHYRTGASSIYYIPAMFWLTEICRPRTVVQLGLDDFQLYFSVCQAVSTLNLDTNCFAFTERDEDGDLIINHNFDFYGNFSKIEPSATSNAMEEFDDGSVDVVMLGGNVSITTENLLKKLSSRSILVIYGSTAESIEGEISDLVRDLNSTYPALQFKHSDGLLVFLVGSGADERLIELASRGIQQNNLLKKLIFQSGTLTYLDWKATEDRDHLQSVETLVRDISSELENNKHNVEDIMDAYDIQAKKMAELKVRVFELSKLVEETTTKLNESESACRRYEAELESTRELVSMRDGYISDISILTSQLSSVKEQHLNTAESERKIKLSSRKRLAMLKERYNRIIDMNTATIASLNRARGIGKYFPSASSREINSIAREIAESGLFDAEWYLSNYTDVKGSGMTAIEHYVRIGVFQGRNPSPAFDTGRYYVRYPGVAKRGKNALVDAIQRRKKRKQDKEEAG